MAHVFLAHAIEGAATDGARLHALPAAAVEYRGVARRHTRAPGASPPTPGGPPPP